MSGVQQRAVAKDEDGMRLDRWFAVNYPDVPFGRLQKLIRTGQVRVDKGRAQTNTRLEAGQLVRVPPLGAGSRQARRPAHQREGRGLPARSHPLRG